MSETASAASPGPPPRRLAVPGFGAPSTLTRRIASSVLVLELFLVLFATLVVYGLAPIPRHLALIGGGLLALLILLAAGMMRSRVGLYLGWLVQLLLIATGILNASMYFLGLLFASIYGFGVIRAEQLSAGHAARAAEEAPDEQSTPGEE